MLKRSACVVAFVVLALTGGHAQDLAQRGPEPGITQHAATEGSARVFDPAAQSSPAAQALILAVETWLAANFDLPVPSRHPQVERVPAERIAALRYRGLTAGRSPSGEMPATPEGDTTVAIYLDDTQTIYLPVAWTGRTPAELSVLVHEMVHHMQNLAGLKYECPADREKLAYAAQDQWLRLFKHSLSDDFGIEGMTLLVRTRCGF